MGIKKFRWSHPMRARELGHVACMIWPERLEPICCGTNKRLVAREAVRMLREQHGTGLVPRPQAFCSARITSSDIEIVTVPMIGKGLA
jgi:hypothetical protein